MIQVTKIGRVKSSCILLIFVRSKNKQYKQKSDKKIFNINQCVEIVLIMIKVSEDWSNILISKILIKYIFI